MNQKKAKALRRACKGMPEMITGDVVKVVRYLHPQREGSKTWKCIKYDLQRLVNHYRNAKKHYSGNVNDAMKNAIKHTLINERIGKYKYA